MGSGGLLRALSIRPFLFLWLSEIFSQIAFNMLNFILVIVAFGLTKSSTAVSGIVLAFTIPAILFGMLAGVYVDRWDKKRVLLVTTLIRFVLSLLLMVVHTNIAFVYLFTFAVSLVTQFFIPAETPMIPLLVRSNLLLSANALFGMGVQGSLLIAFALSGPLLLLLGKTWIFLLLGMFFLAASFFVVLIRVPKASQEEEEEGRQEAKRLSVVSEMKHTYNLIVQRKQISQSLFLLGFSQVLILVIAVIGPGFSEAILQLPVEQFLLVFITPAALGMVVGAILVGNFFYEHAKTKMVSVGLFVAAFSMLLLPYGSKETLVFIVSLASIIGLANALIFVPSNTIIQENTSVELRGKVYGGFNALAGIASLLPVILAGSLTDTLGVGHVITGIGIVMLAIAALYTFSN